MQQITVLSGDKSVLCMEEVGFLWVTPILHLYLPMTLTSLRWSRGKGEATEGRQT